EVLPAIGQILGDTADAKPVWMHSASAYSLYDIKYLFPVGEHVEYRRELPDILSKGSVPYEVAGDAKQFAHHDPDVLRSFGHFNTRQLFYREQIRKVVVYTTQVIYSVGIWNVRMP